MAGNWSTVFETREVSHLLDGIELGLKQRQTLHTWYVIQLQGWVFRNWPKAPPLSPVTVASRRKNSTDVLLDNGTLRQSVTGTNPGAIATGEGTLNMASQDFGQVGTKLFYGVVHQEGRTIRATRAKNLAIPLTRRARIAGTPRGFEPELQFVPSRRPGTTGLLVEKPKGPAFVLHYVMKTEIKTKNGKTVRSSGKPFTIPVSDQAKRGKIRKELQFIKPKKDAKPGTVGYLVEMKTRRQTRAHFLLKPQVRIPARPFLPTVEQVTPPLLQVTEAFLQTLADGSQPGAVPEAA